MSDDPRSKALSQRGQKDDSRAQARLQGLREAIAHSDPQDKDTRRALFLALAQAARLALTDSLRADQREQLEFERAHALFHGGQFHRAGECFEALGELARAADCYRRAGSIEALEAVHEEQDKRKASAESRAQFERKLDQAFAAGRRKLVLQQCESLLRDPELRRLHPQMMTRLTSRQRDIRARLPKAPSTQLDLHALDQPRRVLQLVWGEQVVAGRSPAAQVSINDPSLSREHLALRVDASGASVCDLGSRSGSFLDGDALEPHQAIPLYPGHYQVGLGMQSNLDLWVLEEEPVLLVQNPSTPNHTLVLSAHNLPVLLPDLDGDAPCPFRVVNGYTWQREDTFDALQLVHPTANGASLLTLNQVPILDPEPLELLMQDKLTLKDQAQLWTLEVLA